MGLYSAVIKNINSNENNPSQISLYKRVRLGNEIRRQRIQRTWQEIKEIFYGR